ncbi:GntR family transcriptional regulator [Streptomyces sp. MBT33]|uniref:GntR family transcriptional regulator n=1 Tax=Streptomyces sp. MBT33 TaxID=1488363 RepID=UPI0035ABC419
MATDYRASRNTVREALDLLRAEGLVERFPCGGPDRPRHGHDGLGRGRQGLRSTGVVTESARDVSRRRAGGRPRRSSRAAGRR